MKNFNNLKRLVILLLIINSTISHGQIFNKWYRVNIITNDSVNLITQIIAPTEFEITKNFIDYYDPLDGENYFSFDTKGNLFNDSITLHTFLHSKYTFHIDSVSSNKLILGSAGAKFYFYKIISHNLKNGIYKLQGDKDTLNISIKVSPQFNGDFTDFLVNKFSHSKYVDSCSKIINVSFIVRNNGSLDSIKIENENITLRNDIENFILATNGKWKIRKMFRNYSDNTLKIKFILMSETTKSIAQKNKFEGTAKFLYKEGCRYFQNNDFQKAIYYFSECIIFYDYNQSLADFNLNRKSDGFNINNLNNALMNRAATYCKIDQLNKACLDWEKVLINKLSLGRDKREAREYIKNNCK